MCCRSRNPCSLTFGRFSRSPLLPSSPRYCRPTSSFLAKWDEFRSTDDKMSPSSSGRKKLFSLWAWAVLITTHSLHQFVNSFSIDCKLLWCHLSNGMEWQIFALVSNSHLFPRSHMSTLTQHFFGSRKGIDPVWKVQKRRAWGQSNPRWDRRPLRSRPSEVFHCYQRGDHVLLIYVYSRSEAGAGRSMPLLCDNKCYTYHTLNTITSQLRTFFSLSLGKVLPNVKIKIEGWGREVKALCIFLRLTDNVACILYIH